MAITVCLMFRISFKAGWWYHLQKMSGIPQVGRDGTNAWNQSNPICNREYYSNKWYICIFDYWFMEYSIYYHILVTSIIYWFMVNGELWILLFRIIQSNCIYIIIYTYIYINNPPYPCWWLELWIKICFGCEHPIFLVVQIPYIFWLQIPCVVLSMFGA